MTYTNKCALQSETIAAIKEFLEKAYAISLFKTAFQHHACTGAFKVFSIYEGYLMAVVLFKRWLHHHYGEYSEDTVILLQTDYQNFTAVSRLVCILCYYYNLFIIKKYSDDSASLHFMISNCFTNFLEPLSTLTTLNSTVRHMVMSD